MPIVPLRPLSPPPLAPGVFTPHLFSVHPAVRDRPCAGCGDGATAPETTMNPKMLLSLGAIVMSAHAALADKVYINSPLAPVDRIVNTGPQAQYRIANSAWDMALRANVGLSDNDAVTRDLGNNWFLSMRSYDVYLDYKVGQGFKYTLHTGARRTTIELPITRQDIFGGGGGDGGGDGNDGSVPPDFFNAIRWNIFSSRPNAVAKFAYFTFAGPDLNIVDNRFYNGQADSADPSKDQWIVSDVNLLNHDWSLFGRVQCFLDTLANTDDNAIGFNITMAAVDSPVVPAPGAAALMGVAGLMASRRRR